MCSGSSSGKLTGFCAEEEFVERLDNGYSRTSSERSTLHILRHHRESKDFALLCNDNIPDFSNADSSNTRMWSYSMAVTTSDAAKSISVGKSSCNVEAASPLTTSTLDYSDINYSSCSSDASKGSPESKSTKERCLPAENGREKQQYDTQVHEQQGQESEATGDEQMRRRLSGSNSGNTDDKNEEISFFTRRTAIGGEQQKQRQLRSVSLDAVAAVKSACNGSFGRSSNSRRQWKSPTATCRSLDTLSVRDEMTLADGCELAVPAALDNSSSESYQIHSSSPIDLGCSNSEVWIRRLSAVVAPYAELEKQRATARANAVNAAIETTSTGDNQQQNENSTERCSRTSLLTEFHLPNTVYDDPSDGGSDLERHSPFLVSAQRQREKPLEQDHKLQQRHEEQQSEWEHVGKAFRASSRQQKRQQRHLPAKASSKDSSAALKSRKSSFHESKSTSPSHAVESHSCRGSRETESNSNTKDHNGARLPVLLSPAGVGDAGSEDCVVTADVPSTRQGRRLRSSLLPSLLLSQQQRSPASSCATAHSSPLGATSANKRAKGETATAADRNREDKLNSPFPGVKYCRSRNAWIARWSESGQEKWKTFPVKDSSFEEARRRALEFRQEKDRKKFERLWQQLNVENSSGGGSATSAVTHSNNSTGSAGDTLQTSPLHQRSEADNEEASGSSSSSNRAADGTSGAAPGCNNSSSRSANDREGLSCAVSAEAQSKEDSRSQSKTHQKAITENKSSDTASGQALKERQRLLLLQQELLHQQLEGGVFRFTSTRKRSSCHDGDEHIVPDCESDHHTRSLLGTSNSDFAGEDKSSLLFERSVGLDSNTSTELLQQYTCNSSGSRGRSFALPSLMRAEPQRHIQQQEQDLQQQHEQLQSQQQERHQVQALQQPQQGQKRQQQPHHFLADENIISGSMRAQAPLHDGSELLRVKDAFRCVVSCSTDVKKTDMGAAAVGVKSLLHLLAGSSGTEATRSDTFNKRDSTTARDENLQQHKGQPSVESVADSVSCELRDTSIGSECLEGGRVLQALLCMLTGQNKGIIRRDEVSTGKLASMLGGHKSDASFGALSSSPCAAAAGEMRASRKRRSRDGDCFPAGSECAAVLPLSGEPPGSNVGELLNMYKAALLLIMDDLLQNGLPLLAPSVVLGSSAASLGHNVSPSTSSRSGESLVLAVGEQQQYQGGQLPPSFEKELRAHKAMREMLEEQRRVIAEAPLFVTVSPFVKLFETCIFEQKLPSQARDASRTQLLYLNALNALYEVASSDRKSCFGR